MALVVSELCSKVPGRTLFRGFSLTLAAPERVALVGPSGSGKSTLLRAVALLDDPESGSLALDGHTPDELGVPAYRRRVAYVSQRPVLFPGGVEDNLRRPFRLRSVALEYPEEECEALLSRVGLDPAELPEEARDLSEGQKQRVALVRALATRPEVLLLDEPTSGLDAETTAAVEALLSELAEERPCAMLWVTHDRAQAERACERVVELEGFRG